MEAVESFVKRNIRSSSLVHFLRCLCQTSIRLLFSSLLVRTVKFAVKMVTSIPGSSNLRDNNSVDANRSMCFQTYENGYLIFALWGRDQFKMVKSISIQEPCILVHYTEIMRSVAIFIPDWLCCSHRAIRSLHAAKMTEISPWRWYKKHHYMAVIVRALRFPDFRSDNFPSRTIWMAIGPDRTVAH